jgi:hypothetical protein
MRLSDKNLKAKKIALILGNRVFDLKEAGFDISKVIISHDVKDLMLRDVPDVFRTDGKRLFFLGLRTICCDGKNQFHVSVRITGD